MLSDFLRKAGRQQPWHERQRKRQMNPRRKNNFHEVCGCCKASLCICYFENPRLLCSLHHAKPKTHEGQSGQGHVDSRKVQRSAPPHEKKKTAASHVVRKPVTTTQVVSVSFKAGTQSVSSSTCFLYTTCTCKASPSI